MNETLVANRIYIGAPLEHDSERKLLTSTIRWLEERHTSFVILANVQIGGRQIDSIVATAHRVSVAEIKSSYLPVRGELNGDWALLHASGGWRPYTNGYQQALAAKNALRDAMVAKKPIGHFYPDGYVVFTSGLPAGSQVTKGDFKVAVLTLDQFLSSLSLQRTVPWSLEDWRVFATRLALTPISAEEVVASTEDKEAAEVLRRYNAAFTAEYRRDADRWLMEGSDQQSGFLAAATNGAGCFVTGASGCGKTLMAKWLAVNHADARADRVREYGRFRTRPRRRKSLRGSPDCSSPEI